MCRICHNCLRFLARQQRGDAPVKLACEGIHPDIRLAHQRLDLLSRGIRAHRHGDLHRACLPIDCERRRLA